MKDKFLIEGAVAGHMNHMYDNGEMTFSELKQMLEAIANGKVQGTEKTDGQNIFLSFNVQQGKAKAIRNKGHIRAGGLDVEQFDSFFSEHPSQALRYSFVEALQSFEDAIKEIDPNIQSQIFGENNEVYFNTEVMNPGNPDAPDGDPRKQGTTNVIPYDKKTLLIHRVGHGQFVQETGQKTSEDVSENFNILEKNLEGFSSSDPAVFSIETNKLRDLKPLEDKQILSKTIESIDNLLTDQAVSDNSTINDYVIAQVVPVIEQLGLTDNRNKMILQRVMEMPGKPNLRQITSGLPLEIKDEVSSFVKNFKYSYYTNSLQKILHDFSVAAVNGLESSYISDNSKQIKLLQDELQASITKIQNSSNERAKEELSRQMEKLKTSQGINTASEGFVYDWNGVTYKLTGNFAPANQILGMERFQRFGPIEPSSDGLQGSEANTKPLTIGVVPGAFKPPHKGHLSMVESLAKNADKVFVIISTPTKGGRALPSGKIIDSDHAVQIWNSFLDDSPAGEKTVVIKSPSASPVGVTYDFVMKNPNPNDQLIAPPNSTILLGCGDKEDDHTRYDSIISKAREDLKVRVQVCDLTAKHSQEYIELLKQHPFVLESLPSNKKSSVNVEDLHASDMRYIIDIASKDPIGLSMLQDFVPSPEDALAVMGILGLNAADAQSAESDQVQEPEIDSLDEILKQQVDLFVEGFNKQKAPKAAKSSGKFQRNMKKRLSKAHSFYLDMGRKDLTKHGGGFRLDRPKDISNAFLAEEEIEEASVAASISGAPGPIGKIAPGKKDDKMHKDIKKLRKKINKGLKEYFAIKAKEHEKIVAKILDEHQLRMHLRNMIFEQTINEVEDPTTDVHDNTGINTLKDLLKNTNILSTLRTVYKTLTTNEEQKLSFRAHVIKWVQNTLAPVKLNDIESESSEVNEQLDVDIEGIGDDKFINAEDGSEKEKPQDEGEDNVMTAIEGEDTTGRNKAERIYPTIEKSIVDYYGELDNPEDQEMFYDYLIANLKLYFDKWDSEMQTSVEEPTNSAYDNASAGDDAPESSEEVPDEAEDALASLGI